MTELLHVVVIIIVLCVLGYFANWIPLPASLKWVPFVVLFIVALYVLLPFLGVHLPA